MGEGLSGPLWGAGHMGVMILRNVHGVSIFGIHSILQKFLNSVSLLLEYCPSTLKFWF